MAQMDVPGVAFDFADLYAADVTGRARALRQMVDAGIPIAEARTLAGLDATG